MWMCDRCQSINDDPRAVCPQCGNTRVAQEAPVPRPGAVVPQFSRPFGGEAPAGQPGTAPSAEAPPVSFGAPPSSANPQYPPPVAGNGPPQYPPVTPLGDVPRYAAPAAVSRRESNAAAATGVIAILLVALGTLLLRLLNPIRLVFVAMGIACILGGNYLSHRRQAFVAHAIHATGVVSSLREEHSGDGVMYYPVVQFTPAGGAPITINSSEGSKPPQFHVGERCQVYYNPLDPRDAIIDSPMSRWLPWFLWGFGAIVIFGVIFGKQTTAS